MALFREVFWHGCDKIPRYAGQNSIAKGNLEFWLVAVNAVNSNKIKKLSLKLPSRAFTNTCKYDKILYLDRRKTHYL